MNHTELGKNPRLFMLSSLACAWLGLAACSDGAQSIGDGEAGAPVGGVAEAGQAGEVQSNGGSGGASAGSDAGGTVGGLGGAATGGAVEPSRGGGTALGGGSGQGGAATGGAVEPSQGGSSAGAVEPSQGGSSAGAVEPTQGGAATGGAVEPSQGGSSAGAVEPSQGGSSAGAVEPSQGGSLGGTVEPPSGGTAGEPSAAGSGAMAGATGGDGGTGGLVGYQCPVSPLPLTCGDSFAHSTVDQGHPDQYGAYACSARGYDGRESVYAFSTIDNCEVEVRIEDMTVDLNLFIAPGCDPSACDECIPDDSRMVMTSECSFSPISVQDSEIVTFDAAAGESTTVIIDGYDQAQGSYTITAECTCVR